ncbi:heterokaryon incompatibility domain-containing protein [Trichoderma sp. SZMC 28014]
MEKYTYEPLDLDRRIIRLLHLHRGGDDSEISCSLFLAELNERNDTIPYEALSYTWGLPGLTGRIIVDGCYLNVTDNLHSALQQLRYQDDDRILWIDAICIDQGNKKERGHQVEQMSKIYSEAERVIFWLGEGTVETDMLLESLQLLQRESINYNFGSWSLQDDRWRNLWSCMRSTFERTHRNFESLQNKGLQTLLGRPWFRRVWILQEVALAKAGIIICGSKSVSARLFGLIPMFLHMKPPSHCQSVLDIMPSPWRKTSWWSKSPDLRALLLNFGDSEATEPRDLVYALRGLSSDIAGNNFILPDYEKSEECLVREVVQFVEHCELEDLALTPPPRTVRELIKCLRALSLDRCMTLARQSLPRDMETHLEKSKVRVNEKIFMMAAAHDKTGEVIEVLLRYRPMEIRFDDRILSAAARNPDGAKGIFEALFRNEGSQIYISDQVFIAAAGNASCGSQIFEALLSHKRGQIHFSDEVLETATGNAFHKRDQIHFSDQLSSVIKEVKSISQTKCL